MRSILPIKEAVQAALYFARYKGCTISEYCRALDIIESEVTFGDRERVCPQLAAAARILADEIERLQQEMTRYGVSDCCKWRATTAGKAGATCWWECSFCRKPCRIVIPDNHTQPQ